MSAFNLKTWFSLAEDIFIHIQKKMCTYVYRDSVSCSLLDKMPETGNSQEERWILVCGFRPWCGIMAGSMWWSRVAHLMAAGKPNENARKGLGTRCASRTPG